MAMSNNFQLGLLPERKLNWRAMASSYGFVILLILLLINLGLIWPDRLQIAQKYHVMEIIPVPGLRPKPLKMKTPRLLQAKLLPAIFPAAWFGLWQRRGWRERNQGNHRQCRVWKWNRSWRSRRRPQQWPRLNWCRDGCIRRPASHAGVIQTTAGG